MKKSLIFGIIAAAAIFAASPAWAYAPSQGDLIKVYGNPAVYYVDSSGYRHLFTTEATFFSWYTGSWRDQSIITVSAYDFSQIPSGRNITARPGYSLLRFENSMVMYAVLPGAKLCHAPAHYGNIQYNRAMIIPVGFQVDYNQDNNCDITQYVNLPNGTLFRYANSNDVYYVQNGQRRYVTANGMSANHFHYESIVSNVESTMTYPDGPILDGYDSSISDINTFLYSFNQNGGGYIGYCSENWSCGSWTTCLNSYQYRSCNDLNNCGTTASKPIVGQSCSNYNYLCQENWSCSAFSSCAYGRSYRTCWDLNSCGTVNSKPLENQSCTVPIPVCTENWTCTNWGACQNTGISNGWQFRTCTDSNACGTYKTQPSTSQVCNTCQTNWSCTNWTICKSGQQNRSCIDLNACNSTSGKPITNQSCY